MKGITLEMQYRDGGNWKTPHEHHFLNPTNVLPEEVEAIIEEKIGMYEPIIAQYYGLTSCAPIQNEFLPVMNEEDHSYMEILFVRVSEIDKPTGHPNDPSKLTTINEWLTFIEELTPEKIQKKRKKRAKEAISRMQSEIKNIKSTLNK